MADDEKKVPENGTDESLGELTRRAAGNVGKAFLGIGKKIGRTAKKISGKAGNAALDTARKLNPLQPEEDGKGSALSEENRRRVRKILIGMSAAAASFTTLSAAVTEVFFITFFHRYDPAPEDFALRYDVNADPDRYPRTEFVFPSEDHELTGYLYDGGDKGLILLAHGLNSSADSHLAEIMYFVDAGYTVMTFDGTGVGKSGGERVGGLQQARYDLLSLLDYVDTRDDLKEYPRLLFGHSMGGYGVCAALKGRDDITACAAVAGLDSPLSTMKFFAGKYISVMAEAETPFLYMHDLVNFGPDSNASAAEIAANSGIPVLVVHGTEDEIIDREVSIYNALEDMDAPNVKRILWDEEYQRGHSDILLSPESSDMRRRLEEEAEKLLKDGGDEDSEAARKEFFSSVDVWDANRPNTELLDEVLEFYENALNSKG